MRKNPERHRIYISGVGAAHPAKKLDNDQLPAHLNTSDEWIRQRTGIQQRYIIDEATESLADLAATAVLNAAEAAQIRPSQIDALILATTTPDRKMPATATLIQEKIGNHTCLAFDMQAACAGFIAAVQIAYGLILSGQCSKVAVIGADAMSRLMDWNDRSTCVLFGDGAGAVIIEDDMEAELKNNAKNLVASSHDEAFRLPSLNEREVGVGSGASFCYMMDHHPAAPLDYRQSGSGNIIDIVSYNRAELGNILYTDEQGLLRMNGSLVFRSAVQELTAICQTLLERNNLKNDDISWIIPHQANQRILEAIATNLDLPFEKFVVTVDRYANTSAASIPMALDFLDKNGDKFYKKLNSGDLVIMLGVGAGMVFNGLLLRW